MGFSLDNGYGSGLLGVFGGVVEIMDAGKLG